MDAFFVRLDSSGNVLWAKQAGGTAADAAMDLSADLAGNLYICGETTSPTFQINTQTLNTGPYKSVFYGKLNAAGNNIWMKSTTKTTTSTSQTYSLYAIKSNSSGNVIMSGILGFHAEITFGNPPNVSPYTSPMISSTSNINYLVKLDANGNFISQAANDTRQTGRSIIYGDNLYICGQKGFLTTGNYHNDGYVGLYNSNLTQVGYFGTSSVWPTFPGNPFTIYHTDNAAGLVQDLHKNIYVASAHSPTSNNQYSFSLITLSGSLQLLNITSDVQPAGSTGLGESIAIDTTTNTLYIAGIYNGTNPFNLLGTNLPPTVGGSDMFFIKGQIPPPAVSPLNISAGPDKTICSGSNTQIGGSPTASGGTPVYSYSWAPSTGLNNPTAANPSASPTVTTTYILTVNDNLGQTKKDTVVVTVNPKPAANITLSGLSTFCQGGIATLTSTSASSYLWSNGATTQGIAVTTTGNYTVQTTNSFGCSNTSTPTTITVNPNPFVLVISALGPLTFCQGGSVQLSVSPLASNYVWSTGATSQSIIVTSGGNYTVQVMNNFGCNSTSAITTVTVNPNPIATITASGPLTFCSGGSVVLTSSSGSSYLWSTGATTQSITVTSSGNYSVRVTNTSGCSTTSTASVITVNPNPPVPTISQSGNSLHSSASSGNQWYQGGVLIPGATAQTLIITQPGDYSVVVTNSSGCSASSATITAFGLIRAPLSSDTFYYNAFPNPASKNLNLMYTIKANKKVSIQLMDNFGKVVHTLVNNQQQQAGTYNLTIYNVTRFGTGMYYIRYQLDGERVMQKVIIR